MIMGENTHTPVTFWLQLPLTQLSHWIKDNNEIIQSRKKQN
jgi:hypothetical protein